jgi:hypothetical protein
MTRLDFFDLLLQTAPRAGYSTKLGNLICKGERATGVRAIALIFSGVSAIQVCRSIAKTSLGRVPANDKLMQTLVA